MVVSARNTYYSILSIIWFYLSNCMLSSEHLNQNTSGIKSLLRYLTPDGSLRLESNAERMTWLHFMPHVTANAVCDQDCEMQAKFTSQIYTINKSLQQILTYILLNPQNAFQPCCPISLHTLKLFTLSYLKLCNFFNFKDLFLLLFQRLPGIINLSTAFFCKILPHILKASRNDNDKWTGSAWLWPSR